MPRLEQKDSAEQVKRLKLHDWHAAAGAVFREQRGLQLPWSYSEDSETDPSAGLFDLSHCGRIELVGADRQRFLGGLVTSAVADLEPGQGTYGFVTSIKGKVLADAVVSAFEDRLFLLLPPHRTDAVIEHLSKYIVADRVEVLPLLDLVPIALVGDQVTSALPEAVWPDQPWGCGIAELFGTQLPVSRHERLGLPALVLWVSSSLLEPVVTELVERLELNLIGSGLLESLRVQQGLPAFGIDFDDSNLAQESGIEAIDFTKGCYLGQEVIARVHYRGQVSKIVRRLKWSDDAQVQAGDRLSFEGRPAGTVTTAAGSEGLAMVRRQAAEPGTVVELSSPDSDSAEAGSGAIKAEVAAL